MQYQTFVINLDKSVDRLEGSQSTLDALDIEFERVSAIYGGDLTQSEIDHVYSSSSSRAYYKDLNVGEVGCYLSHRLCWKLIVERELDYAFILEDDFIYQGDVFKSIIDVVDNMDTDWHYIKLAGQPKPADIIDSQHAGAFSLCRFRKVPARTCAQVVSLEGAKRLLAASETFSRPVDIDIQYWWEKGIQVHGILPPPFRSNSAIMSEIQAFSDRKSANKKVFKRVWDKAAFYVRSYLEAKKIT